MLRALTRQSSVVRAAAYKLYFLSQLAAHRRLVRQYKGLRPAERGLSPTPLLIGYFETGFGLGEHVRGLASALAAAGIAFAAYPYNGFSRRARDEAPWAGRYDVDNVHAVNIVCMATAQTANARRIIGARHFENSYNILIAPWELPNVPVSWRQDLDFFHEFWAESRFVADAFRPVFAKPIVVVPPCIDVPAGIAANRQKFGLNPGKFYFHFAFDFSSRPQRKNPGAVLRAFDAAFGASDDVGLIIKTSGPQDRFPSEMKALTSATQRDRRITILNSTWPRADMLALLASIDCYVSLHRSEGFGLGMAEAMALGKPVIATGFSGNADYLTAETGYPVPYTLRPVERDEYPHAAGNSWAEPDIAAAAALMRNVVSDPASARAKGLAGQASIRAHYGPGAVGALAAARLREIQTARR
jgi:glycosyltransferase involved in cell wall biosynthesis